MTETQTRGKANWVRWLLLGIILVAQLTVLIFAPEEKTLGAGIKPVYLHVSLTWTGMLLLAISVLLGVWALLWGSQKATTWLVKSLASGFILFGLGFLVSMHASMINWGGVPFGEPAVQRAIGYMLVGVLLWAATHWIRRPRAKGLISSLSALMLLLATESSQSILHPESPVNTSPQSIKTTFLIMFGLALLLGVWSLDFQRYLRSHREKAGR